MFLSKITWRQAETALKQKDCIVLIPLGSTEQHGPVAPLGTDFIIPCHLAVRIEKRTNVLVTPTMPFGVAGNHASFPGTIDIGTEGLYLVMQGIVHSLLNHGAKKFIFLNGHGGNDGALDKVSLDAFHKGALCAQINWWSLAPQLNPAWTTGHGDAQEVAMIRAIDPALIQDSLLVSTKVNNLSPKLENIHLNQVRFGEGCVKVIRDVRSVISTGGYGGLDSSHGNLEWGQSMKEAVEDYCVAFIDEFRTIDLAKAHAHA